MFALSTPFGIVKLFHNFSDLGMVIKNIVHSSFILKLLPRLFQMYKYMGQHCLLFFKYSFSDVCSNSGSSRFGNLTPKFFFKQYFSVTLYSSTHVVRLSPLIRCNYLVRAQRRLCYNVS